MSDDIYLDDYDLNGDELNFGDDPLSLDFGETKDDRKPIEIATSSAKEGLIEAATDEYKLKELAEKALPKEYRVAASDIANIKDQVSRPISNMTSEVRKELTGLRRSMNKLAPTISRTFGETIGNKFDSWTKTKDETSDRDIAISEEDAAVAGVLSDTFGSALAKINEQRQQADAQSATMEIIRDKEAKGRFNVATEYQSKMVSALDALVQYNNQIDVQYKRSSIEIQQRQLYTIRKLLEVTTESTNASITELKAITKNTALPDILKMQLSENFAQMNQDRLIGKVQDGIQSKASSYMKDMAGNMVGAAQAKAEEIKSAISQISDMVTTYAEMSDMEAEMAGMDGSADEDPKARAIKFVGKQLGSLGFSMVAQAAAKKFLKYLEKNPKAIQLGSNLNYYSNNKGALVDDWIQSNQYSGGIKGFAAKTLGKFAPSLSENREEVLNNTVDDATTAVAWDLLSRKTLVEIIPNWFSKIEANQRTMITGTPQDESTFDHKSDKFISRTQAVRNARSRMLGDSDIEGVQTRADELVSSFDTDGKLTKEQRDGLRRSFIEMANNRYGFTVNDLLEGRGLSDTLSDEDTSAIMGLAKERFKDGFYLDNDAAVLRNKMAGQFKGLQGSMPDFQKVINQYQSVGDKETLRRAGILTSDDNGLDKVNHAGLFNRLNGGDFEDGSPQNLIKPKGPFPPSSGGIPKPQVSGFNPQLSGDEGSRLIKIIADSIKNLSEQKDKAESAWSVMHQDDFINRLATRLNEGDVSGESNDVSREDILAGKLDTSNESLATIVSQLSSISAQLVLIGAGEEADKGLVAKAKNLMAGAKTKATGAFSKVVGSVQGLMRNGMDVLAKGRALVSKGVGLGLRGIGFAKDTALELLGGNVSDIYVKGEKEPRLLKEDIKKGKYIDVNSKTVVKSIKDITGPVIDQDGNYVINEDMLAKGLEERSGLKRTAAKILRAPLELAAGQLKMIQGMVSKGAKFAMDVGSGLVGSIEDYLNRAKDLYVNGELEPRIRKTLMEKGEYIDVNTGKIITSLKDITGEVKDKYGNIVISAEELKAGLFDASGAKVKLKSIGNSIGELGGKIGGKLASLAAMPFKLAGKSFAALRDLFTRGMLSALFLKLPDNVALQANVVHLYTDSLNTVGEEKKVKGDADGDGIRDGSWRDLMSKRKKKVSDEDSSNSKGKDDSEKKENPILNFLKGTLGNMLLKFGGIATAIGGLGTTITSVIGGLGSTVTGAITGLGSLFTKGLTALRGAILAKQAGEAFSDLDVDGDLSKNKKGGKPSAKKGVGAKVGQALKKGGGKLLKGAVTAGRVVGTVGLAGASSIGSGLVTAGGAVLGFLASPIALGALGVLALGTVGYFLWGYFKRRRDVGELERLRFMQYGANADNQNLLVNIRYLEEKLVGEVRPMNNSIDIPLAASEVWANYCEDFGFMENDRQAMLSWAEWYNRRFKPVFLTWLALCSGYKGKDGDAISITDVDDSLKVEDKAKFVKDSLFDAGKDSPYVVEGIIYKDTAPVYFASDVTKYADELITKYSGIGAVIKPKEKAVPQPNYTTGGYMATMQQGMQNKFSYGTQPKANADNVVPFPSAPATSSTGKKIESKRSATILEFTKAANIVLSDIEKVRYFQYGVNVGNNQQVASIKELEQMLVPLTNISGERVKVDVDVKTIVDKLGASFGINSSDANRVADFKAWFMYRFIPIWSRFYRIISKANKTYATYQTKMSGEDEIAFIYNQVAGRLDTDDGHVPFEVSYSPWLDTILPTNPDVLTGFISRVVDKIKQRDGISDETEQHAGYARVAEFVQNTKSENNAGKWENQTNSQGLPNLDMFKRESVGTKDSFTVPDNIAAFETKPTKLTSGGGNGKVAPHDITDKVEERIAQYDEIIARAAEKYGVDQKLIRSVIRQESQGIADARSPVGAVGLMQFMAPTAKDMGIIDRTDPEQNIFGGAKYLKMLLKRYDDNVELALAAYNAGMGNVDKAVKKAGSTNGGMMLAALPSITGHHAKETQGYVKKITADYARRTGQQAGMANTNFAPIPVSSTAVKTTSMLTNTPSNAGGRQSGESATEAAARNGAVQTATNTAAVSQTPEVSYEQEMLRYTASMAGSLTRIERMLLQTMKGENKPSIKPVETKGKGEVTNVTRKEVPEETKPTPVDRGQLSESEVAVSMRKRKYM